jgi:hypothetical protein
MFFSGFKNMSAFYSFCVPQDVTMRSGRSMILALISENCHLEFTFRDKYFSEEVGILTCGSTF